MQPLSESVLSTGGSDGDKIKWNSNSSIEYWYDDYFLAFGIVKIKNKEKKGDERKRTVFYVNKIAYK